MSGLPKGWMTAPIGQLIELNPKNTCDDDAEVGFVPMPLMGTSYREKLRYELRRWESVKKGYTHFADGDVLLAKITPCFENGKAGLARGLPNTLGAGSTEYFVCRPKEGGLHPSYLLAYFKTQDFVRKGAVEMTGSVGHKRVPKDYVTSTLIPLAPLPEQKRIADKLDSVLTRVEACRDHLDRIPALLKRFRQSILAAATSGRLTEDWRASHSSSKASSSGVPGDWIALTVGDVTLELRYGTSQKCDYREQGRSVLRIPNMGNAGQINLTDIKRADFTAAEIAKLELREGDLLLIRSNGSVDLVGKCCIVERSAEGYLFAGYLMRLRIDVQRVFPKYVFYSLSGPEQRQRIELISKSTSGVNNINSEEVKSLPLLVPPIAEQHEIVRRVETLLAFADRLEVRCSTARKQVGQLTPALLAKAFRGELVPQDPADEPAAELLKRLAATRSESPKARRGRKADA